MDWALVDQTLGCLLVVGGLSCSGKTTFIRALQQRALPRDILAALPDGAPDWPEVGAKVSRETRTGATETTGSPGQILHCDLTCCYYPALRELRPNKFWRTFHADDPTFKRSLAAAESIFVITVRPSRRQLLDQVSIRSALVHVPPFARRLAKRYVRHLRFLEEAIPDWMPRLAQRLGPRWRSRALVREQHAMLLEEYGALRDPDETLQDWASWLLKEGGERVRVMLHVEPTVGTAGENEFSLVRRDIVTVRATGLSHDTQPPPHLAETRSDMKR